MLDVCLLGCGGMMPLPKRFLTALLVRHEGSWKIDKLIQTQLIIEEPTAEPAPASPAPQ